MERLFREDKIMAFSIVPLMIRMGLVHAILLFGTNNTKVNELSAASIHDREIGSRLVLASRIFYAGFIWTAKFTVSEFLKRLVGAYWRKSFEIGLQIIRYFLLITFITVIIATLAECQPFNHYWQVAPDPGPKCRQGYAQLITMGVCDVITDILLVAYPIPIVWMSAMTLKRKFQLSLLFMMSLLLVAVTCYRIPSVINRRGSQQYRSLLASLEILAAAGVSNAIVIGSFLRDRGVKKQKFKFGSVSGASMERTPTRQKTITLNQWGSDADLVGDLGMGLDPELQLQAQSLPRPAPVAVPSDQSPFDHHHSHPGNDARSTSSGSSDIKDHAYEQDRSRRQSNPQIPRLPGMAQQTPRIRDHNLQQSTQSRPKKMSFFDVGGLLESSSPTSPVSRRSSQSATSTVHAFDFAPSSTHHSHSNSHSNDAAHVNDRRGVGAYLSDVGSLLRLSSHREMEDESGDASTIGDATTLHAVSPVTPTRTPPRSQDGRRPSIPSPNGVRNFSRGGGAVARPDSSQRAAGSRYGNGPPPPYRDTRMGGPLELVDVGGLLR
ncbi:MAG: hypothetical protein Q9227_005654 [Pyrenula ochraceoflavens]